MKWDDWYWHVEIMTWVCHKWEYVVILSVMAFMSVFICWCASVWRYSGSYLRYLHVVSSGFYVYCNIICHFYATLALASARLQNNLSRLWRCLKTILRIGVGTDWATSLPTKTTTQVACPSLNHVLCRHVNNHKHVVTITKQSHILCWGTESTWLGLLKRLWFVF